MNRKQLTLLIVSGLVIGGLGIMVSQRRAASWNRGEGGTGEKILGDFPINDIAHVHIKQTSGELNLVKEDIWKVQERWGYPANFSDIARFLRTAADLKATSPVPVGQSQLGRLDLLSPDAPDTANAGTLVEFKGSNDATVKSLLVGKEYTRGSDGDSMGGGSYPVGRYVMVPGNVKSASIVSETFSNVNPTPESWLNKEWFKVEKLKSISVVSTNATNNWKIARESETGSWSLVDKKDDERVETNKLSSVGYVLSSPSFNNVVAPDAAPESTGMDHPLVATLETFDNFTYTVRVGATTTNDNYHVNMSVAGNITKERAPGEDETDEDKERLNKEFAEKVQQLEDKLKKEQAYEKWTYLVSKWTIDSLLKERKEFLSTETEETSENDSGAELDDAAESDFELPVPPLPFPEQ